MPDLSETTVGIETPARVRAHITALSDRGLVRDANEDTYLVFRIGRYAECVATNIPEGELPPRFDEGGYAMIVADGLGGHEAGDVASRSALLTTLQLVMQSPKWALKLDDPETRETEIKALERRSRGYLAAIHMALRRQAASDPSLAGMGTTFTGAFSLGADLFVQHVGDSKAYVFRDGALRRITRDHTVAQQYADMGVISQEEVPGHRMNHVLTRAVGGPDEDLEGDIHHLIVRPGDRLLMCSDGLTDMVTEDGIAAILAAHPSSEDAAPRLIEQALAAGGRDNVTVIVADYHAV